MKQTIMQISTNFEFLRPFHSGLADLGGLAESILFIDPGSALTRLRGFAEVFTQAIYKEERLTKMPQANFFELMKSSAFQSCVDPSLINQLHYIRKEGNESAHGSEGNLRTAQVVLGITHQLALPITHKL